MAGEITVVATRLTNNRIYEVINREINGRTT